LVVPSALVTTKWELRLAAPHNFNPERFHSSFDIELRPGRERVVIDLTPIRDDAVMFPRLSVVVCGVGCVLGCAAAQVDDMPSHSDDGEPPAAGKSAGGSGGTSATGGNPSISAGTSAKGGTGSAGMSTGTAGASHAGSAGTGAGGGSGSGGKGSGGTGGTPTKPANTNLPYTEDFEDGEPNGYMPWNDSKTAGPWVVVADGAGKVYQPQAAVGDLEFAVGGSTTWTDVAMSVKVRLADDTSGANIAMRFKDPKTYLVVEMAVGKYKLRGRADGSTDDLISPSPKPVIVPGTWYTVGVVAKGTTVTLTLDGTPIGSPVMCNALISNGGIALGVAEGSVSFDDVKVDVAP
jgi:hypothetical protein